MERFRRIVGIFLSLNRNSKKIMAFSNDAVICTLSLVVSFYIRIGDWLLFDNGLLYSVIVAITIWSPVAISMGVYQTIFRFAGSGTMAAITRAVLVYALPFSLVCMVYTVPGVPRTIGLLQPIVFLLMLIINRILVRYFLTDIMRTRGFRGDLRKVLIYGAGTSGRQLAKSLQDEIGFQIVAFVDDDERLDNNRLDGKKVYSTKRIEHLISFYGVTDIILAMPRNSRTKNRQIVDSLGAFNVPVKTLPPIANLVDQNITADLVRDVNAEDLLGRDPVPPSIPLLQKTILSKKVMVTGAGGSIGSELCKQIIHLRPEVLILVEMAEYALYNIEQELIGLISKAESTYHPSIIVELANVSDKGVVDRLFKRWKPDTVFHAAAYKHVPLVEHNPLGGMRNNILGTYYCAKAAESCGVENFILVSTDKAVRPTNVMGATKRTCELILQALASEGSSTKFVMVRFGNVLGSSGSVVPKFEQQIRAGGPVTLTDKRITRYFMTIPEAAQLVIQAGALALPGEVCVLDMGGSVKIIDLAKSMINLSGLTVKDALNPEGDIEIVEVGLRPGEKLYEELLIGNNPEPTVHPRIFKANEVCWSLERIEGLVADLECKLELGDVNGSIALLRATVPEYKQSSETLLAQ